jgi:endonuclease IV
MSESKHAARIGYHCKLSQISSYDLTLYKTVQVFTEVPQSGRKIKPVNLEKIKTFSATIGNLFVHTPYVERFQNEEWSRQYIMSAKYVNAKGLVYHIPKENIETVVGIIKKLVKLKHECKSNVKILMEQPAYVPTADSTYETPAKLNKLIAACSDISKEDLGFVLDTAHIYAAGVNITSRSAAKAYLIEIKEFDRIDLLHLNGNSHDCKAGCRDIHAIPFSKEDKIWGSVVPKKAGFTEFLTRFLKANKDVIFEIKDKHDPKDIKKMIRLL